jgi:hypothetical protein
VIFAEGIPSESLHLGAMATGTLDAAQRAEIDALFPELAGTEATGRTARRCLRRWESALVA